MLRPYFMREKNTFQQAFGKKIRDLRTQNNLTLEKLALEAGIAYSQVSRIERGKINTSMYTVYILSQTMKVHPAEFFKLPDQEP